jgi:hypothetical protein
MSSKGKIDKTSKKENSFFSRYQTLLIEYPYISNAIQGAIITAGGVMVSNFIQKGDVDFKEVFSMIIVSATLVTPTLLAFYSFLSKLSIGNFGKLLIDQLIFSPIFTGSIVAYKIIISVTKLSYHS